MLEVATNPHIPSKLARWSCRGPKSNRSPPRYPRSHPHPGCSRQSQTKCPPLASLQEITREIPNRSANFVGPRCARSLKVCHCDNVRDLPRPMPKLLRFVSKNSCRERLTGVSKWSEKEMGLPIFIICSFFFSPPGTSNDIGLRLGQFSRRVASFLLTPKGSP